MARRKKGHPIHGWLILDKPLGMTSTTAVNKIKRIFKAQKSGHAGTLDPLASGILPIALGEATKTISFTMDAKKTYRFSVQWGCETTTDDLEGEISQTSPKRPCEQDIRHILKHFSGRIEQIPPKYSAIKLEGQRAYNLARGGEDFDLSPRTVEIENLELVESHNDICTFEVTCGKGTYVRALARDMGRELKCFGHVCALRRTKVGIFHENDALSFDKILEKNSELSNSTDAFTALTDLLLPLQAALDDIPALPVTEQEALRLKHGQSVSLKSKTMPCFSGTAYATSNNIPIAICEMADLQLKPKRVFNL